MPPSASKRAIFASFSTLSATNAPVAPFGDREDHRDDRVARESTDERTIDLNQSNENCSRFRGTARFGIVEATYGAWCSCRARHMLPLRELRVSTVEYEGTNWPDKPRSFRQTGDDSTWQDVVTHRRVGIAQNIFSQAIATVHETAWMIVENILGAMGYSRGPVPVIGDRDSDFELLETTRICDSIMASA